MTKRGGERLGALERRHSLLKLLCRRRHETVSNLAIEFNVSERTIRRDIAELSLEEPIYTQTGRYSGGVYVLDNYNFDRMYFKNEEENVIKKIYQCIKEKTVCALTDNEEKVLETLLRDYSKPKVRKSNE